MDRSKGNVVTMKAALLALALGCASAFVACGGSSGGNAGGGGDGGAGTTTTGGGATCEQACSYSFANCPGEFQGTEADCVAGCKGGQPPACVACLASSCLQGCFTACTGITMTSSSSGGTTTSSSSTSSTSTSGAPTCGMGTLDPSIGTNCFGNNQCPTNACDNNTPNALNGYCTQACKDISDCPCDAGGHVWSCELNPKLGAVVKYCIDKSKY